MRTIKVDHESKYDTLYVALGDKYNSYGDDSTDGIILMRDLDTDHITGFTILKFFKKYRTHNIPELPSELNLSIEDDILPLVSPL